MANPLKGEVQFTAGENSYTLAFPINSIITLEEHLGFGVTQLGVQMQDGARMGMIRTMFWAGLIAHHHVSEEDTGEIIDLVGITESADLVGRALALAMPSARGAKGTGRPRTAAAGTGKPS
ncbi:hypothetical protein ACFPIF_02465 [Brevundimonas faecalis]|uniref:hypothetical protein n=1 Tax=Brevundimonas faecalis TaxID=947378 RepID=UPI003609CA68